MRADDTCALPLCGPQLEVIGLFCELAANMNRVTAGNKEVHGADITGSAINDHYRAPGCLGVVVPVKAFHCIEYFLGTNAALGLDLYTL